VETGIETRRAWRLVKLAACLGTSVGFLRNEIRRGRLTARKCGRTVLVLDGDLKEYLDHRRIGQPLVPNTPSEGPDIIQITEQHLLNQDS
jgi:hypothetical protein